jgi:non-lysosomal glucosylceramidase
MVIESPRDNGDASMKRLTATSDSKTLLVKKLDPDWVKTLADRGEPTLYTKANSQNFAYIGMPVGGIGAGEIYLSGDGRLWDWDVFGSRCVGGFPIESGAAYASPHKVGDLGDSTQTVLDQGFVLRIKQGDKTDTRTLDKDGFSEITFSGQYPIGSVDYSDPTSPVRVHLEAFSPYIPSDIEDSSYPATILNYTAENISQKNVECTIGSWMENAAGISLRNQASILLENSASKNRGYTVLSLGMKEVPREGNAPTMFDDFESGKYDHWKVEGDTTGANAFGSAPAKKE